MEAAIANAALMGDAPLAAAQRAEAARVAQQQQAQFREGQLGLTRSLDDVVSGRAPSVAEMQGTRQIGNLQRNIMGNAAAAARGGNAALALRTALAETARLGGDAVANAAMLRAQEAATARGQMAGVLEAGRSADIGLAGQDAQFTQAANVENARLAQQVALANQGAQMTAATTNQQAQQAVNLANQRAIQEANQSNAQFQQTASQVGATFQQQTGVLNMQNQQEANRANQASQLTTRSQDVGERHDRATEALQSSKNVLDAETEKLKAEAAMKGAVVSGGAAAAGSLIKASDRRLKTGIADANDKEILEFLAMLRPKSYRYKSGGPREVGIVAQDLEKSRMGKNIVRDTDDGKGIDVAQAAGAFLAALGNINSRISKLEKAA